MYSRSVQTLSSFPFPFPPLFLLPPPSLPLAHLRSNLVSISHLRKRGRRRRRLAILLLAFVPDFFSRDEAFSRGSKVATDPEERKVGVVKLVRRRSGAAERVRLD